MANAIKLRLVIKDYDFLAPLACGDVKAKGLDLILERDTEGALDRTLADASIEAGELSFSRQLSRLVQGDRSFVGIPVFPQRAFRHRCFFVRRDSGLDSIEALAGKRIGTNEWPASGNVWSRAILSERNVAINGIRWWVGSVDGKPSSRPQGNLPPYVQTATDRTLLAMLLAGELDALMAPQPPKVFFDADRPVVRLLRDYRSAEIAYFRRTGLFPVIHVIGVRRPIYEQNPAVLLALYEALAASKRHWQANRRRLSDTTPWTITEVEDATALFGPQWYLDGLEGNREVVQALCDELHAQGLHARRFDGADAFTEFESVMASSR